MNAPLERRAAFEQNSPTSDWRHYDEDGNAVEICNGEFRAYVDIPVDIRELEVVFSVNQPSVAFFELEEQTVETEDGDRDWVGLETENAITWYDNARAFMSNMYDEGYRYARVEY